MYIVTIYNGAEEVEIHNEQRKLTEGKIVQSINTIDSFTFSVLPQSPAFGKLNDFQTLVTVYNTVKQRFEFYGRVLCTSPAMSEDGLITQEATCESYLGFLCDSVQPYVKERNWGVQELLAYIIEQHNNQVERYKQFHLGEVDVTDPNDNLYLGIQRENTWETIKKKLLDVLGGELRFRVVDGKIYLDYLKRIGEQKGTKIALSHNMKSIVKDKDPSAFITRLIPLGAKVSDDSEERVDITTVNGGLTYIDDTGAIAEYGIHVGYVEFDDVTEPANLLTKGKAWLAENNKVLIKYSITALDLSLIGLDVDDFEVHNSYPVQNKLLGIDDVARINKKTIDICQPSKATIEIGENFKTLSEIQREQVASLGKVNTDIAQIFRDYATTAKVNSEVAGMYEAIKDKIGATDNDQLVLMLNASDQLVKLLNNRLVVNSTHFSLTSDGQVTMTLGGLGDWRMGVALQSTTSKGLSSGELHSDNFLEGYKVHLMPEGIYMKQTVEGLDTQPEAYIKWGAVFQALYHLAETQGGIAGEDFHKDADFVM